MRWSASWSRMGALVMLPLLSRFADLGPGWASRRAGIAVFLRCRLAGDLADFEQVEAKRLDISQDAIQPRLIQHAGQDRLRALTLPCHRRKCGKQRGLYGVL